MRLEHAGNIRAHVVAYTFFLFVLLPPAAWGQINVFLDYSDFQARLDEATSSAGVANFTSGEVDTIRANILASLNNVYAGYEISFVESNPGGVFERLWFGDTGGSLGVATRIDFRNQFGDDLGRIFTANFDFIIESADPRATQIAEFSTALAGTSAHELGHNLGLEHRDPYGISTLPAADSGGGNITNGAQNLHIMATGSTGLDEGGRQQQRSLSDLSHVKLEFAAGVVATPLNTTLEQAGAHDTAATAQSIALQDLNVGLSGYTQAAVVEGSNNNNEDDYYSIDLLAGQFVTFETVSTVIFGDEVDTLLQIFDTDGSTLLAANDNTTYALNDVNMGGFSYSSDSSIYNFFADATGTYFINVAPAATPDTGFYELLIAATAPIPEPAGGAAMVLLLVGMTGLRRRPR